MSTVTNFLNLTINAVLRPTFTGNSLINCQALQPLHSFRFFFQNCAFYTEWHHSCRVCFIQRQNSRYFRCPVWKTKSW